MDRMNDPGEIEIGAEGDKSSQAKGPGRDGTPESASTRRAPKEQPARAGNLSGKKTETSGP